IVIEGRSMSWCFDEIAEEKRKTETTITRYSRNIIIIDLEDDLWFVLPGGEYIYAQDSSLMYIMCANDLLVVDDDLEFERFPVQSSFSIGGVRIGKVLLNQNLPFRHLALDLGEKHRRMQIKLLQSNLSNSNNLKVSRVESANNTGEQKEGIVSGVAKLAVQQENERV
ncbi:hypothetical protein PENTCL1PPCAC_23900, partial [Pristionchus entomophagus]